MLRSQFEWRIWRSGCAHNTDNAANQSFRKWPTWFCRAAIKVLTIANESLIQKMRWHRCFYGVMRRVIRWWRTYRSCFGRCFDDCHRLQSGRTSVPAPADVPSHLVHAAPLPSPLAPSLTMRVSNKAQELNCYPKDFQFNLQITISQSQQEAQTCCCSAISSSMMYWYLGVVIPRNAAIPSPT